MEFNIKYHEHSGFSIKVDDIFFMFDYYKGYLPIQDIKNRHAAYIFVSHKHQDHYNKEIFKLDEHCSNITYIFPKDMSVNHEAVYMLPNQKLRIRGITVETFDSTDEGVCYLITYKGKRIFHAGDLNLWSWRKDSTDSEIQKAQKDYFRVLNTMLRSVQNIDIAFFPLDPRMREYYEEGAVTFLESFNIGHFFPMHMWGKYRAANVLDEYEFKNTIIYKVNDNNKEFRIYIGDD